MMRMRRRTAVPDRHFGAALGLRPARGHSEGESRALAKHAFGGRSGDEIGVLEAARAARLRSVMAIDRTLWLTPSEGFYRFLRR